MRKASRLQRKVPVRFTSTTWRHVSRLISSMGWLVVTPALFTSTSRRPCASIALANKRRTSSSRLMSATQTNASPPASRTRLAVSSSASR